MKEPIIVKKEAFQAIGVSLTTTNEIEASTDGKISGLWNRYFQ
ncbi:GyrI-like domain-containing protein, partial [Bacillus sp. B-TM1]